MKNKKSLLACFIMVFTMIITLKVYAAEIPLSKRIAGDNRYSTAVEISKEGWETSNTVIIATGENFPDALCAAPLAKQLDAPILLTDKNALNAITSLELTRLMVKKVYIIGGPGVVSETVKQLIESKGIACERIFGNNRYATSIEVAKHLNLADKIVVATGNDFPDALSIAPIAAKNGFPIILTDKTNLPEVVRTYLSNKNIIKSYIIGGTGVITDNVKAQLPLPDRIYGSNRYETNIAILNRLSSDLNFTTSFLATGNDFPDALAGSALASKSMSPIILTDKTPGTVTSNYVIGKLSLITSLNILGGAGVIPNISISILLGDTNVPALNNQIVGNSSGGGHSMAVTADGRLFAWGRNDCGQVGNGQIDNSNAGVNKPVQVKGLSNIIAAAGGREHSLALKDDGSVWAFGSNNSGVLGTYTTYDDVRNHPLPAKVLQLANVVKISAGWNHSMALKNDGTVWTWGSNADGQLGDGTPEWSNVPVQAKGLTGVIAISAGYRYSLALKNDGTVWAWGYNEYGFLGTGTDEVAKYAPAEVIGVKDIISIGAGYDCSIALKKDGTVISWRNRYGPTSTGGENLKDITAVSAGYTYNLALKKDGTVWIWGTPNYNNDYSYDAVQVPYIKNIKNINAGSPNVSISDSGDMWAWGSNYLGGLGDGTNIMKNTPVKCLIGTNYSLLNSVVPANGSTNVSTNSGVHIIYSNTIKFTGQTIFFLFLKDPEGNVVKGRTSYDDNTYSLFPFEKLKSNTKYTVNIPGSTFQFNNGEFYKDAIIYTFTTEASPSNLNTD